MACLHLKLGANCAMTVNCHSSAQEVRAQATLNPKDDWNAPLRYESVTGELKLICSLGGKGGLEEWCPNLPYDKLILWCKMPICRMRLYHTKAKYEETDHPYAILTFPEGTDTVSAIQMWRKRVSQAQKGTAVFEGTFDARGPVELTEPPILVIHAAEGEAYADDEKEIIRKKLKHDNRKEMGARWNKKGMSEELQKKIEAAEVKLREKKRLGGEYFLKHGWVTNPDPKQNMNRHNEIQTRLHLDPMKL